MILKIDLLFVLICLAIFIVYFLSYLHVKYSYSLELMNKSHTKSQVVEESFIVFIIGPFLFFLFLILTLLFCVMICFYYLLFGWSKYLINGLAYFLCNKHEDCWYYEP